jgi:hypothetical protein
MPLRQNFDSSQATEKIVCGLSRKITPSGTGFPVTGQASCLIFQKHWPTHEPNAYIEFIRHGKFGEGQKRMGESNWLRLTERWTATAKSVFLFDIQGSVAKSTFAGLPWLLYLRNWRKRPVHFWPFDGWEVPAGNRR